MYRKSYILQIFRHIAGQEVGFDAHIDYFLKSVKIFLFEARKKIVSHSSFISMLDSGDVIYMHAY